MIKKDVTILFFEKFIPKNKKSFTRKEVMSLMSAQMKGMISGFNDGLYELKKYQDFHDHVKSHFEKEHPDWEVMCKICNKTFEEITESLDTDKRTTRRKHNISVNRGKNLGVSRTKVKFSDTSES